MEYKASHKYAPISARKARLVADMVRGMPVDAALDALRTTHQRASFMLDKVIRSAAANAGQQTALSSSELYVKEAFVNEGPLQQGRIRWRPGAMGRIKPYRKRTSHIHVTLKVAESQGGRSKRAAAQEQEGGEE